MIPMLETIPFTAFKSTETQKQRLARNNRLLLGFILNVLFPRRGLVGWQNIVADIPQLNRRFASIGLVMRRKETGK